MHLFGVVTWQAMEWSMRRMIGLTMVLVLGGFWGCSAQPTPMVVLMPTYSFERDGIDMGDVAATNPRPIDVVAAAEP